MKWMKAGVRRTAKVSRGEGKGTPQQCFPRWRTSTSHHKFDLVGPVPEEEATHRRRVRRGATRTTVGLSARADARACGVALSDPHGEVRFGTAPRRRPGCSSSGAMPGRIASRRAWQASRRSSLSVRAIAAKDRQGKYQPDATRPGRRCGRSSRASKRSAGIGDMNV
jgi:hypothetical protein